MSQNYAEVCNEHAFGWNASRKVRGTSVTGTWKRSYEYGDFQSEEYGVFDVYVIEEDYPDSRRSATVAWSLIAYNRRTGCWDIDTYLRGSPNSVTSERRSTAEAATEAYDAAWERATHGK